jgi:hypothetical protein
MIVAGRGGTAVAAMPSTNSDTKAIVARQCISSGRSLFYANVFSSRLGRCVGAVVCSMTKALAWHDLTLAYTTKMCHAVAGSCLCLKCDRTTAAVAGKKA